MEAGDNGADRTKKRMRSGNGKVSTLWQWVEGERDVGAEAAWVSVGQGPGNLGGAGGRGRAQEAASFPVSAATVAAGVGGRPRPEDAPWRCGKTKQGRQLGLGWPGPGNP